MDESNTRIRPEFSSETRTAAPRVHPIGLGGTLPLSYSQRQLWLSAQRSPSPWHQVTARLTLRGKLDRGALRAALDRIVARHQVLRTAFPCIEGEPRQVSEPIERGFALIEQDIESDEAIEQVSRQESLDPFDLPNGPLIRGRLLRLSDDEHVMLITQHRIVSDSSSIPVLIRELSALYSAFVLGRSDPLPPLKLQYADYASWQRQSITTDVLDQQLEFWKRGLTGATTLMQLPTDRRRLSLHRFESDCVRVKLSTALAKRLRQLARQQQVSLFVTLLSGWMALLGRWCGQAEVIIGACVANRRREGTASLIGPFENTLVLRICMEQNPTVEQLLKQAQAAMTDAYAHQDVPFEMVVEALDPMRTGNPLAQVQVTVNDIPAMSGFETQLPGLKLTDVSVGSAKMPFDLSVSLHEEKAGLTATLEYASDLFERKTVERMAACWETLLKGMVKHARRPISRIAMLPARERELVLYSFNDNAMALPQAKLIHELFEEQVERTPDLPAVMYEDQSLTYAELNGRANQLARYLRETGVGADQLVGICVERSLEMVVGLLGILKAGAAYVPLDPNYPAERLEYMLDDAAPLVVLTQERLGTLLPAARAPLIKLDGESKEIEAFPKEKLSASERGLSAPRRVYVIYTSGSTGRPKGTEMAHRAMVNLIEWHRTSFSDNEGKRVLQFAALSFDVAFQETFATLCTGGTLVLLDEWVRRDPKALTELLSRCSIQRLFVPPLVLQRVAEFAQSTGVAPISLEDVITAGEQLRITAEITSLFKRLEGCRLHNHYGPTESHVVTSLTLTGDPDAWPTLPTIGRPIANTQIYLLDACRNPVPTGVSGEIYIGGANVACGYLNRPQLTAERFIPDPFSPRPEARLYKTGDLGQWRSDGTLQYLGRNDDQVKIRGFRVELAEIEEQLARHPQVKDAAVVAREGEAGNKRLVGYVTARATTRPGTQSLRTFLQTSLPDHMVPSAFVVLERLPLTPSGKLDRRALPPPDHEAYVSRPYTSPRGEIEELLAGVWQELLRIERVGRDDNFFELGGDSIAAMQVIAQLRSSLSIEIPMSVLFEHPTLALLSPQLERLREAASGGDLGTAEDDVDGLLQRVAAMSDGQVQALLREMTLGGRT